MIAVGTTHAHHTHAQMHTDHAHAHALTCTAIDGVDEAADLRDTLVDMLFSQLYASGHCLVVTTRPEGLSSEAFERFKGRFLLLDLAPLSDEQQRKIVAQQLKGNKCFHNLDLLKEVLNLYY